MRVLPKDDKLIICYNIENVENLNVGLAMQGSAIGSISSEISKISIIRRKDPEVARALEQLSKIDTISKDIEELTDAITKYYNEPQNISKNKKTIKDKLDIIKTYAEIVTTAAQFYNIIASSFNLPTIPI